DSGGLLDGGPPSLPPARPEALADLKPAAAQGPDRVRPHRPGMRAGGSVVLAEKGLELSPVLRARIAVAPVEPAAVPDQPVAGLRIEVGPEEQLLKLRLECRLGLSLGTLSTDLAPEDQPSGHRSTLAPLSRPGQRSQLRLARNCKAPVIGFELERGGVLGSAQRRVIAG